MKSLLLAALLMFSHYLVAQTDNYARLEAANALAETDPDKALEELKAIIATEDKTSPTYARAFFNIAVIYTMKDDVENSKVWYYKVMASSFDANEPTENFMEPYACYQHNAAMQLGIFLYRHQVYTEALNCLEKAQNDYPFLTPNATDKGNRGNTISLWMARCYLGLKKSDEALALLIGASTTCYSSMQEALDGTTMELIDKYYDRKEYIKSLNKGLKKLKKVGDTEEGSSLWEFKYNKVTVKICVNGKSSSEEDVLNDLKAHEWFISK